MPQVASLIWLAAGASLVALVTRVTIPPVTWLALTLMVHASRSMPAVPGLAYVWLALSVALAIGNRNSAPVSGPGYFLIVAFAATTLTLPFALDRLGAPRLSGVASTLIFPMAWVAVEFLQSRLTSQASWGSIAYTQYGYLPFMQLAAFVGIWGITFMVAWFASTFESVWAQGFDGSVVRIPVVTYVAIFGTILFGGAIRLAVAPTDKPSMRVATLNRPVDLFIPGEITRIAEGSVSSDERPRLSTKLTRLHDWFLEGSRREARAGARLIVWPETSLLIFKDDEPAFLERARRLAADEHVYLAMGMGTVRPGAPFPLENKLILVDPSGQIRVSYLKSHPVIGWEAGIMQVGDGRVPVIATRDGRMASAICFDADFPEFIRQAAQGSADILILPVNDWKAVKEIHFQMAAFRAIENGVPLVRAAASGLSTAFDPWGRILGAADYFSAGDRTMTAQVPIGGIRTLYARTGDVFAWSCVVGLILALGITAVSPGKLSTQLFSNGRSLQADRAK
jgi:apolipoprotein N-acyltransferase